MNNGPNKLTKRILVENLNRSIDSLISSILLTEWDENHISFSVVSAIRDVLDATILQVEPYEKPTLLRVEAYKISGKMEQTFGDIVIAINNIDFKTLGFGFYEAKVSDENGEYPAFRIQQLRGLTTAAPRLSVLLYERYPSYVYDDDMAFSSGMDRGIKSSRARVIGANIASRTKSLRMDGLGFQSFGYQFVSRYLSGRDLDYSRKPHLAMRKWLRVTKRAPPLIVGITISNEQNLLDRPTVPGFEFLTNNEYLPLPPSENFLNLPNSNPE